MSAGVRKSVGGRPLRRRGRAGRGFSLIELLVVIMIIGILSALAIPTMSTAKYDRDTYNDAGAILQLFREARTRAVGRGAAEMLAMTSNGSTDRGTFQLWEAVAVDPTGNGSNRLPVPNCTAPTNWSPLSAANLGIVLVDAVSLNTGTTTVEAINDIETKMYVYSDPTTSAQTAFTTGYICFTPMGRAYVDVTGSPTVSNVMFEALSPNVGVIQLDVARHVGGVAYGTIRSVLLPPNGMARLFSHT